MILEREGMENTREMKGTERGERNVRNWGWKPPFYL